MPKAEKQLIMIKICTCKFLMYNVKSTEAVGLPQVGGKLKL